MFSAADVEEEADDGDGDRDGSVQKESGMRVGGFVNVAGRK